MSPHHQGLEVGWLRHMEGGSKLVDAQGLVRPADSSQQGEKEAHCAPRLALPLHTQAVLLGEPRSCLTYSDSPELSESAGGRIRRVHVVLPLPGRVGPLAHPLGSGARALRENHPDRFAPRPGSRVFGIQGNLLSAQNARKAGLLQGRSGSEPASACKPAFGSTRGGLPVDEGQFFLEADMPEADPSMAPALGQPSQYIPGFQGYCPLKALSSGVFQTCPGPFLVLDLLVPFHSD